MAFTLPLAGVGDSAARFAFERLAAAVSTGVRPLAHHTTHEPGGSDPMAVDAAAATGSLRTLGKGAAQAAAGDQTEFAFSSYHELFNRSARLDALTVGTYFLTNNQIAQSLDSGNQAGLSVIYLNPADYAAGTRTAKYRVHCTLLTNATAPTVNFTAGLYPINSVAGGAAGVTMVEGVVVLGSTVLFTAPALSTRFQGNSGDFTAPAAGYYALGVVVSGSMAASSSVVTVVRLQMRQI